MDHFNRVAAGFHAHIEHFSLSVDAIASVCEYAAELATHAILAEQKLFSIGVGGDSAAAIAFTELLRNGLSRERPTLPAVELIARAAEPQSAGVAWLAEQLRALSQQGDVALVFCSTLANDDVAALAEIAAARSCEVVWIGSSGPGLSLAFPDAPTASKLLLNQATALCLAELIDINTFGPMEE